MDAQSPVYVYFVGTAGSGKSTLVGAFKEWCQRTGIATTVFNLDPGVDSLPYTPDVDIREWINVAQVMEDHNLGPNGAQVAAADMLALHAKDVKEVLDGYREDYVLVDTPGQIELFGFRSSSQAMMRTLSPERAMIAYMFDPNLVRTPAGFISSLMLWATVSSRFLIPSLGILAKADLVEQKHLDKIAAWTDDLSVLYADATEEEQSMHTILNVEFLKAMEDLGILSKVIPTSALNFFGMEDLYNGIQQTFAGGEDIGEK